MPKVYIKCTKKPYFFTFLWQWPYVSQFCITSTSKENTSVHIPTLSVGSVGAFSVFFHISHIFLIALKAACTSVSRLRSAQAHWPPANRISKWSKVCLCAQKTFDPLLYWQYNWFIICICNLANVLICV